MVSEGGLTEGLVEEDALNRNSWERCIKATDPIAWIAEGMKIMIDFIKATKDMIGLWCMK